MTIKLIEPPTIENELVTLDEVKLFLRIDHSEEDILIETLIKVAREHCESITRRALAISTYELILDNVDSNTVLIPLPPLNSVESIITVDKEDNETIISSEDYYVNTEIELGSVTFKKIPSNFKVIKIKFKAGYNEFNTPQPIIHSIKLLVSHMYDNREIISDKAVNEIPFTVNALLSPYKVMRWI
ncbi:hypothetical protein BTR23_07440 [Alkalihalophilus pseudofirmus]|nr:hypothetical protein BTR23_07440 [Alkalihalophilus pseudofirmus]